MTLKVTLEIDDRPDGGIYPLNRLVSDAYRVARFLGVAVEFEFLGVDIRVTGDLSPGDIIEQFAANFPDKKDYI